MQTSAQRATVVYYATSLTIYTALLAAGINFEYFWDNIQQIGNEGFFFYRNDFDRLLVPMSPDEEIHGTGYHMPAIAFATALLWKCFGMHLWVSHVLTFIIALPLIVATRRLARQTVGSRYADITALIVLTEPSVLTQFVMASPDFVMLSAFMCGACALALNRRAALMLCIAALCMTNMRGVFAAGCALPAIAYVCRRRHASWADALRRTLIIYLPAALVMLTYYTALFANYGWFFADSDYTEHYVPQTSLAGSIRHAAALGLRTLEYGRFGIWIAAAAALVMLHRQKAGAGSAVNALALFVLAQMLMFLALIFVTQVPFGTRYLMLLHAALTIATLAALAQRLSPRLMRLALGAVIALQLTGHFWIYPERISQPWDCTLMHTPYYRLKPRMISHIDSLGISGHDVQTGFVLSANPRQAALDSTITRLCGDSTAHYYLYSNICNEEDSTIDRLHDTTLWQPVHHIESGVVFMTLYRRAGQ